MPATRKRRVCRCALQAGFLVTILLAGCHPLVFHRDTNAPGNVAIETPPSAATRLESRPRAGATDAADVPTRSAPGDPGERFTTFNPGIMGGYGASLGQPEGQRGTGFLGFELTVNRGTSPHSHNRDAFFIYPLSGHGVSLGWNPFQWRGTDLTLGPVYAEAHVFRLFAGAGIGWAVDIDDGYHGPQATAWFHTFFVRARYMFGDGFGIFAGSQLKIPFMRVESQ